ncbi:MAG TPA: hypothetical protein VJ771_05705 [Candidatus Nitrosotalea sp.]|nr:hypothetical protein [Candidatus Nitrosotalea sp.]
MSRDLLHATHGGQDSNETTAALRAQIVLGLQGGMVGICGGTSGERYGGYTGDRGRLA